MPQFIRYSRPFCLRTGARRIPELQCRDAACHWRSAKRANGVPPPPAAIHSVFVKEVIFRTTTRRNRDICQSRTVPIALAD